jgi:uncharacterized membrane protein/uncharacterized membrane protein YeaQ/YmgE (transglycosylase-associated protein family)
VWELITWTATGLGVGWIARTVMRSTRDFGLLGDLTTGWLGGLVGGWLFRRLGVIAPEDAVGHVVVSLAGAAALLAGIRLLKRVTTVARAAVTADGTASGIDLEDRIAELGDLERRILSSLLNRQLSARDPAKVIAATATFGERVADRVALFGGSWTFIGLFFVMMIGWMALNQEMGRPFDPYPYILLNLVLSCLAALQAPVIMMSQNRQAAHDRMDAKGDYEVNVRAEMEVMALHAKLDALREQEWLQLLRAVDEQRLALAAIQRRLDEGRDATMPRRRD